MPISGQRCFNISSSRFVIEYLFLDRNAVLRAKTALISLQCWLYDLYSSGTLLNLYVSFNPFFHTYTLPLFYINDFTHCFVILSFPPPFPAPSVLSSIFCVIMWVCLPPASPAWQEHCQVVLVVGICF